MFPLPVRIYKKNKKIKSPKSEKEKEKKKGPKRENKERGGASLSFIPHLCFMFSTNTSVWREFSYYHSFITMWGTYIIELGLYIPMMSLLK